MLLLVPEILSLNSPVTIKRVARLLLKAGPVQRLNDICYSPGKQTKNTQKMMIQLLNRKCYFNLPYKKKCFFFFFSRKGLFTQLKRKLRATDLKGGYKDNRDRHFVILANHVTGGNGHKFHLERFWAEH